MILLVHLCMKVGSLTRREEHRLWVLKNMSLRKIIGPKMQEIGGD